MMRGKGLGGVCGFECFKLDVDVVCVVGDLDIVVLDGDL